MTHERRTFNPVEDPEQILSVWHRSILSPQAVQLYTAIWYKMRNRGQQTTVWMDDEEASRRARILIRSVPNARAELINVGLLECWQGSSQWSYSYVRPDDPSVVGADTHYKQD
jgi:hypothetical protein